MRRFYLGGDASKGYCDFVILDHRKNVVVRNFQLDDTYQGHQKFCSIIEQFHQKYQPRLKDQKQEKGQKKKPEQAYTIYAALESTGGYENNWYKLLWKLQDTYNLQVARLNPLGVKHHKEANMDRVVTDKISARSIAEYQIDHAKKVEYNKEDFYAPLRRHWKFVRTLKKQQAQLLNQLESLMYVAQPQMLKYCVNVVTGWVLEVLKRFPTARRLAAAKRSELTEIPYITAKRAIELIQEARTSVASALEPNVELIIQSTAQHIQALRRTIKLQVDAMTDSSHFPEVDILTSFKGIGEFSAFGLLIEIGAVERFATAKKLACFFGLHPAFKLSGDGTPKARMSKMGRREPRWILYNVAMSAVADNEMIKALYNGYLQRGVCKMAALGIIMHKILRIVYGMLKNKTMYNPDIDRVYRNRQQVKRENPTPKPFINRDRRFQDYDENAPISKIQMKKRRQILEKKRDGGEGKESAQ